MSVVRVFSLLVLLVSGTLVVAALPPCRFAPLFSAEMLARDPETQLKCAP